MFYIKIMYILNKRKYNYMNSKVEKKRAFLIDLLYAVAIMALIYVFFKYCFAVAAPFLLSFFNLGVHIVILPFVQYIHYFNENTVLIK